MANKIVKSSKAGALWKGIGYLQIGLIKYDVKIIKNPDAQKPENQNKENYPQYKLIQFDKQLPDFQRFICNLFTHKTQDGTEYLVGTFDVGFGVMQVRIFPVKERQSENSPTSIIWGRLLMEDLDKNKQDDNQSQQPNLDEISEEDIPF